MFPSVRQWTDVSCVKHPELQVVLLEGKEKEESPTQTIFPLPSHRSLSHRRWNNITVTFGTTHKNRNTSGGNTRVFISAEAAGFVWVAASARCWTEASLCCCVPWLLTPPWSTRGWLMGWWHLIPLQDPFRMWGAGSIGKESSSAEWWECGPALALTVEGHMIWARLRCRGNATVAQLQQPYQNSCMEFHLCRTPLVLSAGGFNKENRLNQCVQIPPIRPDDRFFCCHICFHPQVCGTAHGLSAFNMYLNVCFYIFNALTPASNGRYTAVKWSFSKCTTLLRRRSVLRLLSNIPKTCFIPEKQNTINNITPVSGTRHGHLMCGFVLSVLCECFCCANGAAMCYWEEGLEYMRQKNTTHPPWALLNINTRQHSKNTQRDTPMYGRKEVRAVAWNAGILQTPDLVDRDEMSRTVKSGSYKIPRLLLLLENCICSNCSLRTQKWRPRLPSHRVPEIHHPVVASLKEEP